MRIVCICLGAISYLLPGAAAGRSVDQIVADYTKAVGGLAAVDRIENRETLVDVHHARDLTLYWEKPNHVLSIAKGGRTGYDGNRGWTEMKNKIKKLARGSELPLEAEANPLRWVHLKDLYADLTEAPGEEIDGVKMDVILAPNSTAASKFYFDAQTHLLRKIEEKGESSVYFTNTFEYLDYREVDGVKLPYRILHETSEPNTHGEDFRVKEVTHNLKLASEMFQKPLTGAVVLGGKR